MIHLESLLQNDISIRTGTLFKAKTDQQFSRNPVSLSSWLSSKKQRILAFYSL